MKDLITKKMLFTPLVLVFGILGTAPALAVEASSTSTVSSIDQSVLELGAAKDDDKLSPEEKVAKEIEARTKIIGEALTLSFKEIGSLQDKLNQLPKFADKSAEKEMQEDFLAKLDNYNAFFEDEGKKLDDIKANESDNNKLNDELKDLAKEIKDYRDGIYSQTSQKVVEFTLVFYDENAVTVAKTRLNKVNADLRKLEKLGLIEKGYFKTPLDKASKLISGASDLQLQAKGLILNPADEGESETSQTSTKAIVKPKPRELIDKSLSQVKSAYDIFLKISKDVRRLLGID